MQQAFGDEHPLHGSQAMSAASNEIALRSSAGHHVAKSFTQVCRVDKVRAGPLVSILGSSTWTWRFAVICAFIFCNGLPVAQAQQPANAFDPPDRQYQSGLDDIDSAVERTLPVAPRYRAFIPAAVDLSSRLPIPGQQGRANSCTSWAVAYAARSYYTLTRENRDIQRPENLPSPNYVYTLARQINNQPVCHSGSSLLATVEVLKHGALSLAQYPYHSDDCEAPPSAEVVRTANDFKVRGMRLLNVKRLDDVKGALAQSNPVIIEFHASSSFQQHRGDSVYHDAAPEFTPGDLWHAMTLVGYDEKRQAFRVINSWGRGWGDGGYAWIDYDVFSSRVRRAAILETDTPPVTVAQLPQPAKSSGPPVTTAHQTTPVPTPASLPAPLAPPSVLPIPSLRPTRIEALKPIPAPSPEPTAETKRPSDWSKPAQLVPSPAPERPAFVATSKPELPKRVAPLAHIETELADLQALSCAHITVKKRGDRNTLSGFVGSETEVQLVTRIAADVPKTGLGEIMVAPWPQCEALQTLERALATADRPKIDIGQRSELRQGDPLRIDVHPLSRIGYLYVSYVQSDGSVINLVQPQGIVPEPTLPGRTLVFGDGKEGRTSFTITSPFGREMIIALESAVPLFASPLPYRQTDREYLTELRQALINRPSKGTGPYISASIKTLQTHPR